MVWSYPSQFKYAVKYAMARNLLPDGSHAHARCYHKVCVLINEEMGNSDHFKITQKPVSIFFVWRNFYFFLISSTRNYAFSYWFLQEMEIIYGARKLLYTWLITNFIHRVFLLLSSLRTSLVHGVVDSISKVNVCFFVFFQAIYTFVCLFTWLPFVRWNIVNFTR